jgi:hypothetical protein
MNDRVPNKQMDRKNKPVRSATDPATQDAYGRLYGQMLAALSLDPKSFQLMMPGVVWDWEASNGFIDPAQYNFCSVIPSWTAVGGYQSTDALFDASYFQFLNTLSPEPPPDQQEAIHKAQEALQVAQNQQSDAVTVAQVKYKEDPTVVKGVPSYTTWLTSDAGLSFQAAIAAADTDLKTATNNYQSLVKKCDQNLATALAASQNQAYYANLNNGGSSPMVPNWTLSMTSSDWVDSVSGGTDQTTISYNNSQAAYDFNNSWAQGSVEIPDDFFSLQVSGEWQSTDEFYTDSNLSISITASMTTIAISPDKWYSPVTALANGPYLPNYSEFNDGQKGTTYMFGEGGVLPLVKTEMLVVYNPVIKLTISSQTYQANSSSWSVMGGISIGPFSIDDAGGGSSTSGWIDNGTTASITVTDTSGVPKILGVVVGQPVTAPTKRA